MSKKMESNLFILFLCFYIVLSLWDIKLFIITSVLGLIVLPFCLKNKNNKKRLEVLREEQSNKRDKVILTRIKDIEIERKWGENTYCVVCEYWSGNETFTFRSIPVKYELNLCAGQEIEVMVESDNLSNYYVMLNDYIILPKKKDGLKIGGIYFMSEEVWGRSKEKQILVGCLILGYMLGMIVLYVLAIKGILSLTQERFFGLLALALIYVIKKKVDW